MTYKTEFEMESGDDMEFLEEDVEFRFRNYSNKKKKIKIEIK